MPASLRVAGLKPEERVAGLKPEERLAGLTTDEQILALSNEVLATFPASYLEALPPQVRAEVDRRLNRH
jgi:hypothetical protein